MEKIVNIKTVIKNLNILTIVLRKFSFTYTHLKRNEVPLTLGDNTTVTGLIKDLNGMPAFYIIKKGKGYNIIPHHYDEEDEESQEVIIHKIKQEYIRTEILKTAFQCGWHRLTQRRNGNMCQIVLAV
jgi:hypothetical protein